jgi:SAM-dependent methyltransferase
VDEIGERNRRRFDDPDAVAAYQRLHELTPCEQVLLDRHVHPGDRVLDLGVGTGRTTPWLLDRASRYVGIDIAPAMVAAAQELHPSADLRVGDASRLDDLADGSFDVVVFAYNGIDYLSDDDRGAALDEVHRVLADGGRFVLSTHDPRAILAPLPTDGPVARRVGVAVVGTLTRCRRLLPARALRRGEGWVLDPAKGGLLTHHATPAHVEAELRAHGFEVLEIQPGDLPRRPSRWRTPWWYYAAERR